MNFAAAAEYPAFLRIGSDEHQYNYEHIGSGVYRCSRGSAWASDLRLFLVQHDGFWYAVDAPTDSSMLVVILTQGVPVFRSAEAVLDAGWHKWETNMEMHTGPVWTATWTATGLSCLSRIGSSTGEAFNENESTEDSSDERERRGHPDGKTTGDILAEEAVRTRL